MEFRLSNWTPPPRHLLIDAFNVCVYGGSIVDGQYRCVPPWPQMVNPDTDCCSDHQSLGVSARMKETDQNGELA
jgi:hypothetical protein